MNLQKNILVPVDFSDNSRSALDYAINIGRLANCKIHLINAYQKDESFYLDEPQNFQRVLNKDLKEQAILKLKEFTSHYLLDGTFSDFEYAANEGKVKEVIINAAKAVNPDFIIMGTSGTGNNVRYGSVAQEIVTASEYPVLVIPPQNKFSGIKKVIYATDCNYSDTIAIQTISELVRPYQGEIILVHIADEDPEAAQITFNKFKKVIEEEFPNENINFQVFSRKNIIETLELLVQTHNADMLSMTTQKRNGFFEKLFNPSITEEIALYTTVPLFAFVKKLPA
jgi:nucleotide-binding universal stress UspA family protein